MCVITTITYAQIINIQTTGVVKVVNGQQITCSGNYSFSINRERALVVITNNQPDSQNCFNSAGTYGIKHVETVIDNTIGKAIAYLMTKNNIDYVMTITNKMISFSQWEQTNQLCWHFGIDSK